LLGEATSRHAELLAEQTKTRAALKEIAVLLGQNGAIVLVNREPCARAAPTHRWQTWLKSAASSNSGSQKFYGNCMAVKYCPIGSVSGVAGVGK
jgi:hypothetical protein